MGSRDDEGKMDFPPIRACLFDMDGLLIDSEDIYTLCTNEILREYGKPNLPWNIKAQLQGRPGPEAGRIFNEWAQLPLSHEEYMGRLAEIQRREFSKTKPLPGVVRLLHDLKRTSSPQVHIAVATSSHTVNYRLKTDHLEDLFAVFPNSQIVLGDDPRIPPGKGKPAPDIYLLALQTINDALRSQGGGEKEIEPHECLVFEDSVPGVEAGRRAGMRAVWVPHPELLKEYRGREKEVLAGLTGTHPDPDQGQHLASQAEVDVPGKEHRFGQKIKGSPGQLDDGWAELLESLEHFPYHHYSINVDSS